MDAEALDDKEARDDNQAQGSQESPRTGKTSERQKAATRRKPLADGILPKVASEDEPRNWGDDGGYDHDAWLKEQRPPHWG